MVLLHMPILNLKTIIKPIYMIIFGTMSLANPSSEDIYWTNISSGSAVSNAPFFTRSVDVNSLVYWQADVVFDM